MKLLVPCFPSHGDSRSLFDDHENFQRPGPAFRAVVMIAQADIFSVDHQTIKQRSWWREFPLGDKKAPNKAAAKNGMGEDSQDKAHSPASVSALIRGAAVPVVWRPARLRGSLTPRQANGRYRASCGALHSSRVFPIQFFGKIWCFEF